MPRRSPEEAVENYVRKSLLAYIENDHLHLNWITGCIGSAGVQGEGLENIFEQLKNYPRNYKEKERLQQVYNRCLQEGWL